MFSDWKFFWTSYDMSEVLWPVLKVGGARILDFIRFSLNAFNMVNLLIPLLFFYPFTSLKLLLRDNFGGVLENTSKFLARMHAALKLVVIELL